MCGDRDGMYRLQVEGEPHPHERPYPTMDKALDAAAWASATSGGKRVHVVRDGRTEASVRRDAP